MPLRTNTVTLRTRLRQRMKPIHMKLLLVAAGPATLATVMFNYSSHSDGSAAIAGYRFAITYVVTAINFCAIRWIAHRVSEFWRTFVAEQRLRRAADKRAHEMQKSLDAERKLREELEARVATLEQANRCREKVLKAWTDVDDAKVFEMFLRLRESDGQTPN